MNTHLSEPDERRLAGSVELSVIVPVFNEVENITSLVAEIRTALGNRYDYEIIYIDDGSRDGTIALLQSLADQDPLFRYVRHHANYGQSAAIATGVRHARGHLIATLDGDGQNDPADIPELIEALRHPSNQDTAANFLVVGRRQKRRDAWVRRISSRLANGIRSRLLKDRTPDTGSGLKVFPRTAFLGLPHFDHMHRFLPALFLRNGGQVLSIAVNHRERRRGRSKYGIRNRLFVGIVDLFGVMWLQRRPIRPIIDNRSD